MGFETNFARLIVQQFLFSTPTQAPFTLHFWHLPLFSAWWGVSWWSGVCVAPVSLAPAFYFSTVLWTYTSGGFSAGGASFFSRVNALSTVNILSPASHCDEQTDTNHCADERKGEWRTSYLYFSNDAKVHQQNKGRITSRDQLHAGLLCIFKSLQRLKLVELCMTRL